jgi:glycosyltransferase involved in cell wall biosynthesis
MTQDFSRTVKFPIDKVRTIYHGVGDRFRPIRDPAVLQESKAEYCLPEHFLLFVGHVYPQKNFANLARAFSSIAKDFPHDLVVAGRPRWKEAEDYRVIEELGIMNRIHFLHIVPNHDLPALYSQASCFVYPSLYESFGLAQLEAMACGCPVLGSNTGAIPEVAGDAALLFDPHSPDDMARALRRILTDEELRRAQVEKGFARAREFTWEKCAAQTLQLFKDAVAT